MLSAFSWGQFWTVILLLVVLYYAIVAAMYYREEIAGLFSPKADKPTNPKPPKPSKSPSLVKTASALTKAPVTDETNDAAIAEADEQQTEADEAMGTSPGTAPADVVHGSLPDTHSAGLAISEKGELSPALSLADIDKQQEEPELDEVDEKRKEKLRAAMAAWEAETTDSLTENLNQSEPVIENSSSIVTFEEENVSFVEFEEELRYAEIVADEQQIIEVDVAIPAELLLRHLSQLQDVASTTELPQLVGTSLAQQLEVQQVGLNREHTKELDDLFGTELS